MIHGQHGGELFVSKFFAQFYRFHFTDQNLGAFGNGNTGQLGDFVSALTDDTGVERAVDKDGLADFV